MKPPIAMRSDCRVRPAAETEVRDAQRPYGGRDAVIKKERANVVRQLGGYAASALLALLGIAMVVVGFSGRSDVQDRLAQEAIVGTPGSSIEDQAVDTGS